MFTNKVEMKFHSLLWEGESNPFHGSIFGSGMGEYFYKA